MLTSEQYVERDGTQCPACECEDIGFTDDLSWSIKPDRTILCQRVFCGNCSASWTEQYKLYRFTDLDTTEESEK